MATLTYTFVGVCSGGGHVTLDVALNAGQAQRIVYPTDDLRSALSELTQLEREELALLILKLHFTGKGRAAMRTELQSGPVVVTI